MKLLLGCLSLLVLLAGCGADESSSEPRIGDAVAPPSTVADVVYTNGRIYTVDTEQPWAEAVAIHEGHFVAVGSSEDVAGLIGESTDIVDLKGAFAMPGIGDSHIHPGLLMAKRAFCALPGTFHEPTERDTLDALGACIKNYPADRPRFIAQGFTTPVISD